MCKYISDLFVLILYSVILNSTISSNRFFGSFIKVFYIPPSHLQLVIVLLLSFQFGYLLSYFTCLDFNSVQFTHSGVSHSLRPHGLQNTKLPSPSLTPGACWNSYRSTQWCHPNISSFVIPFPSCFQSFPASGSFLMSQFFTSGCQSIVLQLQHQPFQWTFRTEFL